jgi:hypothetical protein
VCCPLLVTVQNLLSFSCKKTKLAPLAPHPSFVHGMDIVFFNDIFGLLRRAKMKSQFCDVAKLAISVIFSLSHKSRIGFYIGFLK